MLYRFINEMFFFEQVVETEISNIANTEIEIVLSLVLPLCLQCSEVLAHRKKCNPSPKKEVSTKFFVSSTLLLQGFAALSPWKKAHQNSSFSA